MNRAVQYVADAEEGQSLHSDLPYASFTSVREEGFIKGLFCSLTFDLSSCSSLLSITHREAEKEGDKKRDGFKLWKWIKPYVALEWGDWEETGELSAAASLCTSGSAGHGIIEGLE